MFTHKVEYSSPEGDTLYCEVDYECKFGSPGTYIDPPEPDEINIVAIRPISDLDKLIIDELIERLIKLPGGEQSLKEFWAPIIEWIEEHCYEELCDAAEEQSRQDFED